MSETLPSARVRIYYFDVLRAVACLAVIMIHVSAGFATKDVGSVDYWIGNAADALSRFGVPIFVMLSGALLLDEKYEYTSKKLIRHIVRIAVFFVFWSICYQIINVVVFNKSTHPKEFFYAVLKGPAHLWYCFMIAGLYLIVPILRLWVKRENKRQVELFLILALIFACLIPICLDIGNQFLGSVNLYVLYPEKNRPAFVCGFTFYFILGWYLHTFPIRRKKMLVILGIAGVLVTIFGTFLLSRYLGKAYIKLYEDLSVNVCAQSVLVFFLVQKRCAGRTPSERAFLPKVIRMISATSFGIYAVHYTAIQLIRRSFVSYEWFKHAWVQIPLLFVLTLAASTVICLLLHKSGWLRKLT